jgi:endo-1,4-beta-D-glucanase Y
MAETLHRRSSGVGARSAGEIRYPDMRSLRSLGFFGVLAVSTACGTEDPVDGDGKGLPLNPNPTASPGGMVTPPSGTTTNSTATPPSPVPPASSPGGAEGGTPSVVSPTPGSGGDPVSGPNDGGRPSQPAGVAGEGNGGTGDGEGGSNSSGSAGDSTGNAGASQAGANGAGDGGASPDETGANFPFPVNVESEYCTYPTNADPDVVRAAYEDWKTTTVTSDGAGGFMRVKKPDSGNVIGSTVSEGMGYGMLLAVYMNDQAVFDNLWQYVRLYLNENGLMDWEIDPNGSVIGSGAASDGDEDMAFALVMADRQWGGSGSLDDTYLNYAIALIDAMWEHEVDHSRNDMLKAGDTWGDVDITNPSYFAPAYFRVFGRVTGKEAEWNRVVASSYDVIEASLNAQNGNQDNGLVPAWCTSTGVPTEAYAGAPTHFQQDSTRTPFRVGQDYCYFGEPRAKAYLEKITSFYQGVGVANIVDGYDLDGTPRPERATNGLQTASFVGPAGVGAMNDPVNQMFIDEAYAAVATLELTAGTIYYQKSWTALSLLMLTGNFVDFTSM